jgi:PAS domain
MGAQASSDLDLPDGAPAAALDALPYGIVVIDQHERVTYANEHARRLAPDDLRIGETARWASIQQPSFDKPARRGEPERDDRGLSEISTVTISGALGGLVRPMRVLVDGLDDALLIVLSPCPTPKVAGETPSSCYRSSKRCRRSGRGAGTSRPTSSPSPMRCSA